MKWKKKKKKQKKQNKLKTKTTVSKQKRAASVSTKERKNDISFWKNSLSITCVVLSRCSKNVNFISRTGDITISACDYSNTFISFQCMYLLNPSVIDRMWHNVN